MSSSKNKTPIRILSLSGSPVRGSSTEILLRTVSGAVAEALKPDFRVRARLVRLNELEFVACQACGEAPTPKYCFFDDDLTDIYRELARADAVLFGSPVYFDSVSAQAKLFIDRCNCVRPADFDHVDPAHDFLKLLPEKRPGAMVFIGGKRGWFEGTRRVVAGFFKWVEVSSAGTVIYRSEDFTRSGTVANEPGVLAEAEELGRAVAARIREKHD